MDASRTTGSIVIIDTDATGCQLDRWASECERVGCLGIIVHRTINSFTAGMAAWMWSPHRYVFSRRFTSVVVVEVSNPDGRHILDGIAMGTTNVTQVAPAENQFKPVFMSPLLWATSILVATVSVTNTIAAVYRLLQWMIWADPSAKPMKCLHLIPEAICNLWRFLSALHLALQSHLLVYDLYTLLADSQLYVGFLGVLALSELFKQSEERADLSSHSRLRLAYVWACALLGIAGVVFHIVEFTWRQLLDHTVLGVIFSTLKFMIGAPFIVNGWRLVRRIRQSEDCSTANQQRRERFARFVFYTGVAAVVDFGNACLFPVYVRSSQTLYIGIVGDFFTGTIVSAFSIATIRPPNTDGRLPTSTALPTGSVPVRNRT
ncbi:THH1/TOM1/TOM3 domain-containing protein [Plasmodiophora brassicae]|nr:hypothetical protein PBRA_000483 [Plasmodiophora brassicae]